MSTGEADAVRSLYSDHHGWLINWLRRKLGCAERAADLAHDTFLRVIVQAQRNDLHVREPRAFLTRVASGLVIDHWRRQELERAYLEAIAGLPPAQVPSCEERAVLLETLTQIDAMLEGLAPKARAAFLLANLDGMPHAAIASQLGVTVSSVEKYLATALRHCLALRNA